jgi:hypothetical protein
MFPLTSWSSGTKRGGVVTAAGGPNASGQASRAIWRKRLFYHDLHSREHKPELSEELNPRTTATPLENACIDWIVPLDATDIRPLFASRDIRRPRAFGGARSNAAATWIFVPSEYA